MTGAVKEGIEKQTHSWKKAEAVYITAGAVDGLEGAWVGAAESQRWRQRVNEKGSEGDKVRQATV